MFTAEREAKENQEMMLAAEEAMRNGKKWSKALRQDLLLNGEVIVESVGAVERGHGGDELDGGDEEGGGEEKALGQRGRKHLSKSGDYLVGELL